MRRIQPILFLLLFTSTILLSGCRKKKEAIEGTYIGTEKRYTLFYENDTGTIYESEKRIDIKLIKMNTFELTTEGYPYHVEFKANKLVRNQTVTDKSGGLLFPTDIRSITIKGDSLYALFVDKGQLWIDDKEYSFAGKKQ